MLGLFGRSLHLVWAESEALYGEIKVELRRCHCRTTMCDAGASLCDDRCLNERQ